MGGFLGLLFYLLLQTFIVDCKISLTSFQVSGDESLITNFTTLLYNDSTGMTYVNGSGRLTKDFLRGTADLALKGWLDERRTGTEKLIFKGNINICNFAKGVMGNFVSLIIYDYIDKYSNVKVQCPFPKGFYYVKPCPFDIEKYIPTFWVQKGYWELYVHMKIKLTKSKPTQELFSLKIYGNVS